MSTFRTPKPASMIEFEIAPCTNVRCKPEHVQTIREKMAKAVKAKYRAPAPKYSYPKFEPGMTTAAYLNLYAIGNPNRIKVDYNCPNIDKPAPTLDPMRPEVEQLPDSED